ncbi:hypothetical protein BV898_19516 [Hypsibius exemplaris]|uniref:Uncharacterized protein n=1 Tax=Hypsibius exemplaris TaxID=2072580 RepID=A0A9X6RP09_HYPEX|nr:hypothetical protein BV898_19516 [Hypsibius exemplaris]
MGFFRVAAMALVALVAVTIRFVGAQPFPSTDGTLEPHKSGKEVVLASIEKIDATRIFRKDKQMLRNIAQAESDNGLDNPGTSSVGGIWRASELSVNKSVFADTKSASLSVFASRFQGSFGINWNTTTWQDLDKPLYSALAARLAIALQQQEFLNTPTSLDGKLPWNVTVQSAIWKAAFQKPESASALRSLYVAAAQRTRSSGTAQLSVGTIVTDGHGSQHLSTPVLVKLWPDQMYYMCVSIQREAFTSLVVTGREGSAYVYISLRVRKPSASQNDFNQRISAGERETLRFTPQMIAYYAPDSVGTARVCLGMHNSPPGFISRNRTFF